MAAPLLRDLARRSVLPALALGFGACVGGLDAGPSGPRGAGRNPGGPVLCEQEAGDVGVPLRRLTPDEQQRALVAIFGEAVPDVRAWLPAPVPGNGFTTSADASRVGEAEAEALLEAAEEVAIALAPTLPTCAGVALEACAREHLTSWATRAFRRPAEREDVDRLVAIATGAAADGLPPQEALAVAIVALLQEPRFLYVVESRADAATWTLDAHERAQRLAITYLGAPSDEALLAAAADGSLASDEGLRAASERALSDPRARETFQRFVREWLGLTTLPTVHEPALRAALDRELSLLIDEAWAAEDGFATLVTSDAVYADTVLEAFYGLPAESSGPGDFRRATLPGVRAGVLTHPLVLAAGGHGGDSSPILRGKLVRMRVLCTPLPPPPPGAIASDPAPAGATARERYEARIANPTCRGCHTLLDPIGLGLEAYDGLGRHRTELGGRPIDDLGELIAAGDASGTFDGASELAALLANSDDATRCFAQQWTHYALGRPARAELTCTADDLGEAFAASGRSFPALLGALAAHPSFVSRRAEVPE